MRYARRYEVVAADMREVKSSELLREVRLSDPRHADKGERERFLFSSAIEILSRHPHMPYDSRTTLRKTSCGISTLPLASIFFLPRFCFSRSFIFRVISPPYKYPVTSLRMALFLRDAMIRPPVLACIFNSKSCFGKRS